MTDESTIDEQETEESEKYRRRIDTILSGEYTEGLAEKSEAEVRELRDTAREVETEISFLRRLAQSRLDIFKAEIDRRARGGSLSDLIAALPGILASGETRSSAPNSRLSSILAPSPNIEFKRGMEKLVTDDSLANLDQLTDQELQESITALENFEEEISGTRKDLHVVIDQLESEIAQRTAN
ncbi:MAG TPA: aerial mycelium formation protein [Acidimicrobiia bacterium]|nr:aerial mycelium formation protein [Acidimicrobiia bacterium]